jgi:hypothetical protein
MRNDSGCQKYAPFRSSFKRKKMVVTVSSLKTTAMLFFWGKKIGYPDSIKRMKQAGNGGLRKRTLFI